MSAKEQQILGIIDDPSANMIDVAEGYAVCMQTPGRIDWRTINEAILERWPPSNLEWIKARAWRMTQNTERKP